MPRPGPKSAALPFSDPLFVPKRRKAIPHAFVLEALSSLSPETRPMFGCFAVYIGPKIVLLLRDKIDRPADNGVWLITTKEHHQSLRHNFPNLRSMSIPGKGPPGWQLIPADSSDFEVSCMQACDLILGGDPRIGRVPKKTSRRATR
jgi:hypothetical protein